MAPQWDTPKTLQHIIARMLFKSGPGGTFDRQECLAIINDMLTNKTLNANDSTIFHLDKNGQIMSNPLNPILTLDGCNRICGPHHRFYFDIGPRFTIWLIPILLLVSNIELSPIDKTRFLTVIHLLGDPIDTLWSLLDKVDTWSYCHSLAEQHPGLYGRQTKVVSTILAGFEEVMGPEVDLKRSFYQLVDRLGLPREDDCHLWSKTAGELADSRTYEFLRTCLAILIYIFQIITAFVPAVGGLSSSRPGGRIATPCFSPGLCQ